MTALHLDKDGFLCELDDWSEFAAMQLAEHEGIQLEPEHWEIIWLLRAFYQQYQLSPAMRPLVKTIRQQLGPEKGNSMHLMRLFSTGRDLENNSPAKIASKIAGLPKPTNCL